MNYLAATFYNEGNDIKQEEKYNEYREIDTCADEMEWVYECDDVEYVFNSSTGERIYLVIKGDALSFGKKKISVGDKRSLIETVFKNSKRPKPPVDSFAYYDDNPRLATP